MKLRSKSNNKSLTPNEKPRKKKKRKEITSENNENNNYSSPKPNPNEFNNPEKRNSPEKNNKKASENIDPEPDKSLEQSSHDKNATGSQQSNNPNPKSFQIRKRLTFKKSMKEPKWKLTPQELSQYGNRFPSEFNKLSLLGKGGFSLVWRGEHKETKVQYAIKQIMKRHPGKSHLKEVFFGNYFFSNVEPKKKFLKYPG